MTRMTRMTRDDGRPPGEPAPGERWYRLLLHLYPPEFRERVGREMVEFYRDRWRGERPASLRAAAALWCRVLRDLVATAPPERATSVGRAAARHLEQRHERHLARHRRPPAVILDQEPGSMSSLRPDARRAVRSLLRRPAFTAIVLATLALGIGANAAIFSVVNGVLLRPLPFREPERVVRVALQEPYFQVSEPELFDLRRDVPAFAALAAWASRDANLTGGPEPMRIEVARVTDHFFDAVGAAPALGRAFSADEERGGGPSVTVISHALWQRYFGGRADVIGRTLQVNDKAVTVVGVMPARFDFPQPTTAMYTPLRLNPDSLWGRNNHYLQAVARLAPAVTVAGARAAMTTLATRWRRDFPDMYAPNQLLVPDVRPIRDAIVGDARPFLLALMGAVAFVLCIACVNVANLLLTRGEARRRELAIRAALGASRLQLAQQVLTEGTLLALAGGALGLAVAWAATRGLVAVAPATIPRLDEVRIDPLVLAFTFGVSVVTGLVAALVPAVRAARGAPVDPLRESGKGTLAAGASRRTRSALVVAEVTLAVVTLAGAGLMLRSLWKLQATDLGFSPARVITMRVSPPTAAYDDARAAELWRDLVVRAGALPGVQVAAAAQNIPVANEDDSRWSILLDGRIVRNVSETPSAKPVHVTPGYFRALGMPILRGRDLGAEDRDGAPAVAVVNEAMARTVWPSQDALGHTFRMMGADSGAWVRIVGIVRDVRSGGFQQDVPPTFFVPHAQGTRSAYYTPRPMTLVVRTAGDPAASVPALRALVRSVAPQAPVTEVRTMEQVVAGSIAGRRFSTALLAMFAGVALVLAGIGIYGVIAATVSQRTYEIGLRLALGAPKGSVLALVLQQGLRLAVLGLALGIGSALALTRLLRSMLVDVSAMDPVTFVAVAVGLLGVALCASLVPARRAMAVSPTQALRGD